MEEKRSKEIVVKKGNQKVRNLKDVVNPRRCRRRRSIFSVEAEESVATVFDFVVTCVRSAKHRKYFKKIFLAFNANQL